MGAWSPDSKTNVATMAAGDFRSTEKSVVMRCGRLASRSSSSATTARQRSCKRVGPGPGRRGRRRHRDERRRAAMQFLTEQIARAKDEDVLFSAAPEGHDDEGLRPDHLRPRRARPSSRRSSPSYGEQLAAAGLSPNNGLGAILKAAQDLPEESARRRRGRHREGPRRRPRLAMVDSDKGITNLHVPQRRDRRRLDAGHDPQLRPHVGPRRQGSRHARRHPGQQLRRHLPGCHRRLPRQRRLRSRPPWAPSRTSASWPRRPRSTAATTRPSRSRPPARSASSTRPAHVLIEHAGRRRATSGACARPRTCRSATGSSWPSPAPAPPARPPSSGSTRPARTTPNLIAKVERVPPGARHRGPPDRDHGARTSHGLLAGAHPQGRGHHLGHRQRAA